MTNTPTLRVAHVKTNASEPAPRLFRPEHHLINVAFNNWVSASEKRIDGGRVRKLAGRTVGRSLVMPAGSEFWGWSVGAFDFLRIELDPGALRAASEVAGGSGAAELRPQVQLDDPVLWHLACVLRHDLAMGCPGGQVLRDGVQNLIASHLVNLRPHRDTSGPLSPARLRIVREFIRAKLHTELRLAEIAGAVGMSPFHFARAFAATVGVPPYRYVLEERLVTARGLLEATDLRSGEVARLVGFQTLTGFSAAFRRRWGVPPGQYRAAVGTSVGVRSGPTIPRSPCQ